MPTHNNTAPGQSQSPLLRARDRAIEILRIRREMRDKRQGQQQAA